MAATQRVFDTAELFELILIEVDVKTLLLAQRVNSHWQGNIINSTRLQKKLFFTAATPEDLLLLRIADPDPDSFTMLVSEGTFAAATRDKLGVAGISASDYVRINPFYAPITSPASTGTLSVPSRGQSHSSRLLRSAVGPDPSDSLPRFKLPGAIPATPPTTGEARPSWLRMLITQPPAAPGLLGGRASFSGLAKTAQDLFQSDHIGTRGIVVVNGIAMRGQYYWGAVKRNGKLSSKKAE